MGICKHGLHLSELTTILLTIPLRKSKQTDVLGVKAKCPHNQTMTGPMISGLYISMRRASTWSIGTNTADSRAPLCEHYCVNDGALRISWIQVLAPCRSLKGNIGLSVYHTALALSARRPSDCYRKWKSLRGDVRQEPLCAMSSERGCCSLGCATFNGRSCKEVHFGRLLLVNMSKPEGTTLVIWSGLSKDACYVLSLCAATHFMVLPKQVWILRRD